MKIRKTAFTLIELLVVISIIALLIGILLPALGAARRTANKTKNTTQVRGIVQNATVYAAANQDDLPQEGVTPGTNTNAVYQELVDGDLSPELLVNPVEAADILVSTDQTIEYASSSSAEYSYSWILTDADDYTNDTNTLTPFIGDRSTDTAGAYSDGGTNSVWALDSADTWEGGVGWADGHAGHETTDTLVTSYSTTAININDTAANSSGLDFTGS